MANAPLPKNHESLSDDLLNYAPPTLGQRMGVEFLGTFWLVLGGCGSAVLAAAFPHVGIGLLGVSLAFGLTVLTMAFAFGHISGGHFNPAVTVGLWLAGRQGSRAVLPYIGAQVLGGTVGAGLLYAIASGNPAYSLATNGLAANGYGAGSPGGFNLTASLLTEVVMTMLFLFIILGATDRRAAKGFGPLAIGLGLTLIHLVSIPVTNTSVNPARSTGPALFVGGLALQQLWLFWLAPLLGAAIAGVSYRYLTGAGGLETVASQAQPISLSTTTIGDVTSTRPTGEL
jgi:aquaporin Z